MKRNRFFLLPAACFLVFFESCTHSGVKNEGQVTRQTGDSVKYVRFADAAAFLPSWNKENTVIYHSISDPDDMHPSNGTNSVRSEVNLYTQMALITTDFRALTLHPSLVKAMPEVSPDFLRFTFELRDEPLWDNGDRLEVRDILFTGKANICALTNNPFVKAYWQNMQDILPDPSNVRKFTVVMKNTYMQNIAFWTDFPIMQQAYFDPKNVLSHYSFPQLNDSSFNAAAHPDLVDWAAEFNDPKYGHDPKYLTGMGMYAITSWEAGQSVILTKKKNHWTEHSTFYQEKALPEKIIFKVNRDPNSQELEFKSQTLDASGSVSTKVLMNLQADKGFNENYNSGFIDTYNYSYAALNMKPDGIRHQKLFTDVRVRRALALLTPVDQIIRVVHKGKNKRMVGPVSFLKPEFNGDLAPIPFDVKEARKLLDEAGWKDSDGDNILDKMIDGRKVKMEFKLNYYTTQVEWKDIASMMAEAMYKAGVKADLNPMDVPGLVLAARQHDFDMMLSSWASSMLPEDFTQLWHTSSWTSEGSNYPGFGNAASDALIDSVKYTMNDSLRLPLVRRFQQLVYDEQPYIFLFSSLRRVIVHKRFGNGEMYFERPGLILNNLKLLAPGAVMTNNASL